MKFKKTTNNNILLIFFIFVFLIILQNNKFFRKLYNVHTINLDKRLVNVYGYCGKHSYGFLNEVKNKYALKENLNIVDYTIQPAPSWLVFDTSKKTPKNPNVFINYQKNLELEFVHKDNFFIATNHLQTTSGIKEIHFDITEAINTNHVIQIFKIVDNNKIIIFEKEINYLTIKNKNLIVNYNTDLINSRWQNIYINLKNLDKASIAKISNIKLILKNKYQILDEDIIFKKKNCYYTK
jgi:hypothetical protein